MRNITVIRIPLLMVAFFGLSWSCSNDRIIDRPIIFDEERTELTISYLKEHYGIDQETPEIDPKMVVIHWTVTPTLDKTYLVFRDPKLSNSRPDIKNASVLNVSSQFLVDRDGSIYRLMPENFMARHVIGLNHSAIGIENVGGTEQLPLTNEQLKSNIWIVKYLKKKYDISYLIGHYEYMLFEGHELWLEKDNSYRTVKSDPGEQFMKDIRSGVKELDLKDNPMKMESDSLVNN